MIIKINNFNKKAFFISLMLLISISINAQETKGDTYYERANSYFKNKDWENGLKELDEGLSISPSDSDLYMLKGKYYLEFKNYDKSRYNLTKALKFNPNNVDAKHILINTEIESKHYSSAICFVNELLEVNPYWKGLWKKKIHIYRLQGNDTEANRLSKRINQIYPDDKGLKEDYTYNLQTDVSRYKKTGEFEKALDLSKDLLRLNEESSAIKLEVINTHLAAGETEQALTYLNRALLSDPNNINLINKKASILADLNRHTEAINFLKSKETKKIKGLDKTYNNVSLEAARSRNLEDPYALYAKLLGENPGNREALNYLLKTSLSRGYNIDALYYINKAKTVYGETKDLLLKEYNINKQIGNKSKSKKILNKLYEKYPNDYDIKEKYLTYRFKLAKDYLTDEQYNAALENIIFLLEQPKNENTENILQSAIVANTKLGRLEDALNVANVLTTEYPENTSNQLKKATVLLDLDRVDEALTIYEELISKADKDDREKLLNGYESIAVKQLKKIKESGVQDGGITLIERILEINPDSELALKYAINYASERKDDELFNEYAEKAVKTNPNNIFFNVKYAEALAKQKKYNTSLDYLDSLLGIKPYNKGLIKAKSNVTAIFSKQLIKSKESRKLSEITNTALKRDPDNKELKHLKGIAFEMQKSYDSAYYYKSFYEPSLTELSSHKRNLEWLKHKGYKNQIGFFHLRSRYSDKINVSAASTLEFTHFGNKNTYTARVNYVGRDLGVGYQPQIELTRVLNNRTYFTANLAIGTRYFPKINTNISAFRSFGKHYEAQAGIGYRYLENSTSIFNVVGGITRNWEGVSLNSKVNIFYSDNTIFYNLLTQSKFFIFDDNRSFLHGMFSIGSIPEETSLNFNLYNDLNAFNTMVGAGGQYMINRRLTLGILGNWYNSKDDSLEYRNLYNIYLQAFFSL